MSAAVALQRLPELLAHRLAEAGERVRLLRRLRGGREDLVLLDRGAGSVGELVAPDGLVRHSLVDHGELGPLDRFAHDGRVVSREHRDRALEVDVLGEEPVPVVEEEPLDGLLVRVLEDDREVDASGPEHRLVDQVRVVRGKHRHDLRGLVVDAVEGVDQVVHPIGPLGAGQSLDVFAEDDGGLEAGREAEGLHELAGLEDVEEGPAVLGADLGHLGRGHRLARAEVTGEQVAPLEGASRRADLVGVLQDFEDADRQVLLDFLVEDDLDRVLGELQELEFRHAGEEGVRAGQRHGDGPALVHALRHGQVADARGERVPHLPAADLRHVVELEDHAVVHAVGLAAHGLPVLGERVGAPEDLLGLARPDLEAEGGVAVPRHRLLAVPLLHGGGEGHRALQGGDVDGLVVDLEVFLLGGLVAGILERPDGVVVRDALGEQDGTLAVLEVNGLGSRLPGVVFLAVAISSPLLSRGCQ